MNDRPHIYSPYEEIVYPKRNQGGCFSMFLWTVAIIILLLVIYDAFH